MPISMPPFSNVPAPGDPLQSAWAQQLTTYAVASPRGWVASVDVITAQSGISTVADLTGLTVTWTAEAGRRYLIQATVMCIKAGGAGQAFVTICDAANVVKQTATMNLADTQSGMLTPWIIESGLSGSVTRKLRGTAGAGTFTAHGGADYHKLLAVFDIGKV